MTATHPMPRLRPGRAEALAALAERLDRVQPAWLGERRRAALQRFLDVGFPDRRDEAWRSTDVGAIARGDFAVPPPPAAPQRAPALLPDAATVTVVDGRPILDGGLDVGARVVRLEDAPSAVLEAHLARHACAAAQPFTALNTAAFEDGILVHVPRGVAVPRPIEIACVARGDAPVEAHTRILVVAEAESQVQVVETYAGLGAAASFTNAVTEIAVGPGAHVEHVRVQREAAAAFHVGTVQAALARDSRFTSYVLVLGGALSRQEVNVVFAAEGGSCSLNGLYLLGGRQHGDCQTFVDHARPHATSQQLYKGVLAGAAHGVFNGRVVVRPDAQKTSAQQTNRNLLLSEAALVDTKPQLEIHADDVTCTHGAAIGRLDEDALFYLRARALGAGAARRLLTRGFALDVLGRLGAGPLRAGLESLLDARLADLLEVEP